MPSFHDGTCYKDYGSLLLRCRLFRSHCEATQPQTPSSLGLLLVTKLFLGWILSSPPFKASTIQGIGLVKDLPQTGSSSREPRHRPQDLTLTLVFPTDAIVLQGPSEYGVFGWGSWIGSALHFLKAHSYILHFHRSLRLRLSPSFPVYLLSDTFT